MGRSTVHYTDNETNNILKRLHNKLRPAGTPVERVEYIIELLLLRIFEVKLKQDDTFAPLRKLFNGENYRLLFSHLLSLTGEQVLSELNKNFFPFYASILSKSREVFNKNLPTKIQDQLVLMEEVFANSNFTNNVKGGVVAEVIGLVNEIDESKIIKTDLLGDAIESALSEAGGTQELGVYRTPDHIRKMMVEMVDPDFTDIIFDPSCGTAGFLFNTYEYVTEKAKKTRKFPSENIANQFYRVGLSGIEYQGRIRKMAAVNMYIRGLNPHNIDQGDSLKMYDPSRDAASKSVVIANPPFGAERDQPSYPNVWEDYSKESETTILFVKLMFDLLKNGGRCAVVVSEGFITWGQNSACALRKMLLQEANLRAILSLPQGVFVSKSGQGAKTSILYFEKGQPTDFVWYYKIENDGFSMGTNRKPIEGSQIPELLKIFKEIKQGKKSRAAKYSFCIPREWVETLDPRVGERIKNEIEERLAEKNKTKREKLVKDLDEKLAKKKISKAMHDEKLWQFDNVVKSQIENEVAKAIERAHSYHFNLQNYRSNLSEEQIKDWRETLKGVEAKNGSTIERKYQELKKANAKIALQILTSFDSKNALHMDIAREYLSKLDSGVFGKENKLKKLYEILKRGFQYQIVALSELLEQYENKITIDENTVYKQVTISNTGEIKLREEKIGSEIGTKTQNLINLTNGYLLIYSRLGLHTGAIGLIPKELNGSVVTVDMPVFSFKLAEVNAKYVALIVQSQKFVDKVIEQNPTGAAQTRFHEDNFLQLQIPLPPLEVQNEIVGKIERQKQIIEGVMRIEESFVFHLPENNFPKRTIRTLCNVRRGASPRPAGDPRYFGGNKYYWLKISDVPKDRKYTESAQEHVTEEGKDRSVLLHSGELILTNSGATLGYPSILSIDACIHDGFLWFEKLSNEIDKEYLFYVFKANRPKLFSLAQTGTQPNLNTELVGNFEIPFPPLEIQRQIVEKLDKQMQALEGVRLLRSEAEKRIEEILSEVWLDDSKNK